MEAAHPVKIHVVRGQEAMLLCFLPVHRCFVRNLSARMQQKPGARMTSSSTSCALVAHYWAPRLLPPIALPDQREHPLATRLREITLGPPCHSLEPPTLPQWMVPPAAAGGAGGLLGKLESIDVQ
eukprot:scaffold12954_cov21-Tisochrysis_lutea.AAC.2